MSVRFLPNMKAPSTLIWPHGDNDQARLANRVL